MSKPIWAQNGNFQSFVATATTSATDYPVSRVQSINNNHPLVRRWRSTVITQTDIICDMGSSKSIVAFAVLGSNAAGLQYAHSPDNSSYTALGGIPNMTKDGFDGFYKVFIQRSFTNRYFRVRFPAQTPVTGEPFFSLGTIILMNTINTWPRDIPAPEEIQLNRSYIQSGVDVQAAGPFFITQEIQTTLALTEISQMQSIALMGEQAPFLWFRNWSPPDLSNVYVARYQGGLRYQRYGQHWVCQPRMVSLS